MRRLVSDGEMIPRGYGVAHRDIPRAESVCYPVPLHLPARWLRNLWWVIRRARPGRWERALMEARHAGYTEARDLCTKNVEAAVRFGQEEGIAVGLVTGWNAAFAEMRIGLRMDSEERQRRHEAEC
jgi:hypothetical protein